MYDFKCIGNKSKKNQLYSTTEACLPQPHSSELRADSSVARRNGSQQSAKNHLKVQVTCFTSVSFCSEETRLWKWGKKAPSLTLCCWRNYLVSSLSCIRTRTLIHHQLHDIRKRNGKQAMQRHMTVTAHFPGARSSSKALIPVHKVA